MGGLRTCCGAIALLVAALSGAPANAADEPQGSPIDIGVALKVDAIGPVSGGLHDRIHVLDNIDLFGTADLDRLIGWTGGSVHIHVLDNMGHAPNRSVGTLQGVDNIEVSSSRAHLFEAWIEQAFGNAASIRLGLYDLNSEFYAAPSAGLLLAPPFGIGSEIAATGTNGPSIFPSSALAVRFAVQAGGFYARAAILNASAGTLGDPSGVNLTFDDGALLIAEIGHDDGIKIAAGGWTYTLKQDDIRYVAPDGSPVARRAAGGYALADVPLAGGEGRRAVSAFARIGWSDGRTTPYKSGWQIGLLVSRAFATRPDSAFSIGMYSGSLSRSYRLNDIEAGGRPARSERAIELTYSDSVTAHLTIQPDVQWIFDVGGEADRHHALVLGLRSTLAF